MTATAATTTMRGEDDNGSGGRLVAADGRTLPLLTARLAGSAGHGIARIVLEQRFWNPWADPLRVSYLFPLPHDAAVSGFAFRVGERRIVGEVDRRQAARERFEEAIASGRTAAILDQERGSVFTQELGNIPPGVEVVAELTIDQRLAYLPTGAWEWRFPAAVAPRYQGASGRVPDSERVRVDVADAPLAPRLTLALRLMDEVAQGRSPESPSHAMTFRRAAGALAATLADEGGVALDRDVVVRWPVAAPHVGVALETYRAAQGPLAKDVFALLTLVPPAPEAREAAFARDLVVLIDTSGSMDGEPLDQARRVVSALVETLRDEDTLELIEFSSAPRRWRPEPVRATRDVRLSAVEWLASLRASGGTEMRTALVEALRGIRADAQRQVLLVTDGLIGFESEIVHEVLHRLPGGTRLHTLGVGSAVNRSLTQPASRAGRGTESIVGIGEDVERAVRTLVSRMEAPLVTGLAISGDALAEHVPARLPDLFGAGPALVALKVRPEGGTIRIHGETRGGAFEQAVKVTPGESGSGDAAVAALFGREAVEDLEMRLAAGEDAEKIDSAVERIGLDHQLSTRLTSWVAVSEEPSVDPTKPTRRVRVPQELPYAMSVEGLGLRATMPAPMMLAMQSVQRDEAGAHSRSPRPASAALPPRDLWAGILRASTARPPEPPEVVRFESRKLAGEPPMRGRILLDRHGELVVEVTLEADLDWSPPAHATLMLRNRTAEIASVDAGRTTGAGKLRAGQTLRLVLVSGGRKRFGRALALIGLDVAGRSVSIAIEGSGSRGGARTRK